MSHFIRLHFIIPPHPLPKNSKWKSMSLIFLTLRDLEALVFSHDKKLIVRGYIQET